MSRKDEEQAARDRRVNDALDKLADLYPDGDRLMTYDPALFFETIAAEIRDLRGPG